MIQQFSRRVWEIHNLEDSEANKLDALLEFLPQVATDLNQPQLGIALMLSIRVVSMDPLSDIGAMEGYVRALNGQ